MFHFVPNKEFVNAILLHYFNMSEFASESHRILTEVYGDVIPTEKNCNILFKQFKSDNFGFEFEEQAGASKMGRDEDEEQAGTSKKINDNEMRKSSNEEIVNTLKVARPELMTTEKKMFLRSTLLHYYNMKKNKGFDENFRSTNYLTNTYGNLDRVEQICQGLIKWFKSGKFFFEDVEQADMLKKIEEMEVSERRKNRVIPPWLSIFREKDVKSEAYIPSPKKLFLQRVLLHCFHMKKNASESYDISYRFYNKQHGISSDRTCYRIFTRFKSGNFDLEDEKHMHCLKMRI